MPALPRPANLGEGEWFCERGVVTTIAVDIACDPYAEIREPGDVWEYGPIIAALPERIAREDRVREVCERTVSSKLDTSEARVEAALARDILRLLDGEEGA